MPMLKTQLRIAPACPKLFIILMNKGTDEFCCEGTRFTVVLKAAGVHDWLDVGFSSSGGTMGTHYLL